MKQDNRAENPSYDRDGEPLMGLAVLMRMAYAGVDLTPLGVKMVERVTRNPNDANALLDLATIMHLDFAPEIAQGLQTQALDIRRLYRLSAAGAAAKIRLLAIMTPGDLMANAPLEFLVEGSDVTLDLLYVSPGAPLPSALPEHDLLFVAVNERDEARSLLKELATTLKSWPRPVLNAPDRIALLTRDVVCSLLASAPGIVMPKSMRITKETLEQIGQDRLTIGALLGDGDFPVLARPVGSHAGQGLIKIDDPSAIAGYLQARLDKEFYVTPFVDYRNEDDLFRKYRVALIDGRPYACHMAISDHWMIHYLNAGMSEHAERRAEEARFMADFDRDFAQRHEQALRAIGERMGLDYLIVDCAETRTGELLVFELDSGAVVHDMDPVDVFPYKQTQMRKVFQAFRAMLDKAMKRGTT